MPSYGSGWSRGGQQPSPYYRGSVWRPRPRTGAGAVTPPPMVNTVGVNAIDATTANFVGAVNPEGSPTTWWFTYGTALPLPGQVTASASAGSGTTPVTITFQVTGLTAGALYYFAAVGRSDAGTVYGTTLSFVPAAPAVPVETPLSPIGTPAVSIPHFNVPPKMVGIAGASVVEQDTIEEILACVNAIVECPIGACPQLPDFGVTQLTFGQAPDLAPEIISAIETWEPRALSTAVAEQLPDAASWGVRVDVSGPDGSS